MSFKRNNELVEKIETILNNTTSKEEHDAINELLTRYKNATYKEHSDRHEFYRNMVDDMVNDCSFEDDALAVKMASNHPTLQQNFMRMCVKFIKEMAQKSYCDDRNRNSVEFAKQVMEIVDNSYFPFI